LNTDIGFEHRAVFYIIKETALLGGES